MSVADPHRIKPQPRTDAEKWMDTLAIPVPAHRDVHVLQGSHLSPNPRAVEFLADGYVQRLHPDPTGLVYSLHGGDLGKRRLPGQVFMYPFEGGELRHAGADNYEAVPGRIPRAPVNVADLVREELLSRMREELPYSIATRVTEYEWPRIRCEIVVERDSQKGMVIGKGGQVLKEVGTAVRLQLAKGAHIELVVVVDEGWQQRLDRIERLGY